MSEAAKPATTKAKAYKFKPTKGGKEVKSLRHPVLGVITEEHLNAEDGLVIGAIKKLDERKETKDWATQFLVEA